MTKFQAKCIIGLIWSFALLTPLPTALLSRLIPKQQVIYLHSTDSDVLFASANLSTVTIGIESVGDAVDSESADNRSKAHSPNQNDSNQATQTPIDLAGNSSSLATLFSHTPLDLQPLPELYSCVEQWNNPDHRYLYSMLLMALQYMLPIVVLIYTYSRIAFVVWIKKTPGEAQDGRDRRMAGSKRRMVKMMIIVVSVYTLCWLPLNTLIVIADLNEGIWQIK